MTSVTKVPTLLELHQVPRGRAKDFNCCKLPGEFQGTLNLAQLGQAKAPPFEDYAMWLPSTQ